MKTYLQAPADKSVSPLEAANRLLAREAACEGITLLKNDGTLPLRGQIALYGAGARMTVKGGTGSGEVRNRGSVSIAEGLENEGLTILTKDWLDAYDRYYAQTYEDYRQDCEKRVEGLRDFRLIFKAVPPFVYPTGMPVTEADVADCETAVYVLARQAGEGHDRRELPSDFCLSEVELDNLRFLRAHYDRLVLVVNVGGFIDLSVMDELEINALVYFGQGGEEGGNALAALLCGKKNFSGKLSASWPLRLRDVSSYETYSYNSADPYEQDYTEGNFVGYRYYDSFGLAPRYAFGFGLSYSRFEIVYRGVSFENGRMSVRASVRNAGGCAGKETVQLYVSLPAAAQREKKRLAAFGKTRELQPGEEQELVLTAGFKELAVYDEGASAWSLKKGLYILSLGNSSDSVLPVQLLSLGEERVLEQCTGICPMVRPVAEPEAPAYPAPAAELPVFAVDEYVPETVRHCYVKPETEVEPLVRSMTDEQLVSLVIGGTTSPKNPPVAALGASGTTAVSLYESLGIPNVILSDGPAGLNLTSHVVEMPDGTVKAAKVPENLEAYKRYLFGFNRIALTSQMADPDAGISHYQYATAWPCAQLLAQSFEPELLERIGDAVGREMEAFGVTVWLAPGMNLLRNPLCGRTFEYYSEDPLVSGKMAAALVRGVQSHPGKGVSVKHFVANNCEYERNSSSSNMSEKTLRELYLRGFEIAVKEGRPKTVMASYNKVNGLHAVNNYDLLAKVLRNEWGFDGLVMSDWDSMKADPQDPCKALTGDVLKAHAAQMDLVCPGRPDQHAALLQGLAEGLVSRSDLERSASRILRLIRSNTVLSSK